MSTQANLLGLDARTKRWADLSDFSGLGKEFIFACESTWLGILETREITTQDVYNGIVRAFFRHLIDLKSAGTYSSFFELLHVNHRGISAAMWEIVQGDYRRKLALDEGIENVTKSARVSVVSTFLRALARDGTIPHIVRLSRFHQSSKLSTRRLGDLADPQTLYLRLRNKGLDVSLEACEEAISQYGSIACEIGDTLRTEDIPAFTVALIKERLSRLRYICEDEVLSGLSKLECGDRDALSSDQTPQQLDQRLQAGEQFRKVFEPGSTGWNRLLAYVRWKWGYMPGDKHSSSRGRFRLNANNAGHGGPAFIDSFLNPPTTMLVAAATIALIDTAANVSSIREIGREECLGADDVHPNYRWVNWYKKRSGGQFQRKSLPKEDSKVRLTTVQVLNRIRDATRHLALKAAPSQSSYLFLTARKAMPMLVLTSDVDEPIRPVATETFIDHFKKITSRDEQFDHAKLTPSMLRTYTLLKIAIETRSIFSVQEAAHHDSTSTSWGYVYKLPLQLQHDAVIREFLENLQVLLTHDKQEFLADLGIDTEKHALRLANISRTGLGIDCLDIRAGFQPGSVRGQVCNQVQNCTRCKNASRVVQADIATLTDILLWHAHLQSEQQRMLLDHPSRWEAVWLPWLVFCEVVLDKVKSQLRLRPILKAAQDAAAQSTRKFPRLW